MTAPTSPLDKPAVLERVRTIMRRDLKLGSDIVIEPTTPFIGGDADIDSLDILLILSSVEREFGIKIGSEEIGKRVFENVGTLVDFLVVQLESKQSPVAAAAELLPTSDPLQLLPHRPPFRFVSRLVAIEPGQSAQGVWSVLGNEDFFAGHFPGRPVVPGVLIAEALAQLSGLACNIAGSEGRLAHVDVRFQTAVTPPADIQLRSRVARQMGALIQYEVEASFGQLVVASGTVTIGWSGVEQ